MLHVSAFRLPKVLFRYTIIKVMLPRYDFSTKLGNRITRDQLKAPQRNGNCSPKGWTTD